MLGGERPGRKDGVCLRHAQFKGKTGKLGWSVGHNSQIKPKRKSIWDRGLKGEELGEAAEVPGGGLA